MATDIGGENALILGRFWYFGQSVVVLPERFNLRIAGARRGERCSEIDEPTRRALENWLDDNMPTASAATHTVSRHAIYGYARVSTDGQSVDAQVEALRAAGAEKVFREDRERRQDRPARSCAARSTSSAPATC